MHSNQLIACPHCGAKVAAPTAMFCTSCGSKFDHTKAMTTQPDSDTILVDDDDQVYDGNDQVIFHIKRKKNGKMLEIKDGNNTKILEAILAFQTGMSMDMFRKRSRDRFKEERKMREEANVGNFRYVPLYTHAQKIPMGEISINTEIFCRIQNWEAEYRQRSGLPYANRRIVNTEFLNDIKPLIVKDSNSQNLALVNVPFSERLSEFTQRHHYLPNKGQINPDQFHVETNSGSFEIDVVQEIRGRINKNNHVINVDILDPQHKKSLSIIKRKKNNYEMILYQGLSPFVAQSIACLICHVVWLPPLSSSASVD
ncbi:MAG: zinc ribbon domain-containing protein [Candidatus Hodarchaeales archaeon]|jgi:DNA-directed RNA polymerase subunit RPC12/RpoP